MDSISEEKIQRIKGLNGQICYTCGVEIISKYEVPSFCAKCELIEKRKDYTRRTGRQVDSNGNDVEGLKIYFDLSSGLS